MPSHEKPPAAAPRATVMLVVWPEYGHVVTLLSLAKQLCAQRYRVVFAGARTLEKAIQALGYEYASLSEPRPSDEPTLFDFLPTRAALESAVDAFITSFHSALSTHRPSLILFDSLYSAFGTLASAAGIPWALYETDLPREYARHVPPPHLMLPPTDETFQDIEREWAASLRRVAQHRDGARRSPDIGHAWATAHFPALLTEELQRRLGTRVPFNTDTLYAPVARVPRMVFCPPELDFETAEREGVTWVGPCIDFERKEPDFPWEALPEGRPIAYCALGTQSTRHASSIEVLQAAVDVFSARQDYFLVMTCNPGQKRWLQNLSERVLVVEKAPQLALLRRASLALTHAGFNSLKECAALGVPMVALPLGLDQPRNAALVLHHGLGTALDVAALTASRLDAAVTAAGTSSHVRQACARMKSRFEAWAGRSQALCFVERLLGAGSAPPHSLTRGSSCTTPSTI